MSSAGKGAAAVAGLIPIILIALMFGFYLSVSLSNNGVSQPLDSGRAIPTTTGSTSIIETSAASPTSACTVSAQSYPFANPNGRGYYIQIIYNGTGSWSGTVKGYNAWAESPRYLAYSECVSRSGNFTTLAPDDNPSGESYTCVQVQKLDESSANLTVSVTWGAAVRTNSTTMPYGTAKICEGVAP